MTRNAEIYLTELDKVRLERAISVHSSDPHDAARSSDELAAILDSATIVPAESIPPHVVTMNSTVVLEERASGKRQTFTLAYPQEADAERGRVSVLSPVGRALIGSHVGDVIQVDVPGGPPREMVVVELRYQPEAAGRFDL